MTAIKLANSLFFVVPAYIALSYAILLFREGRRWALMSFVLGVSLIMGASSLRGLYATLTRQLADNGHAFNPWLDEHRGIFYLVFASILTLGAIIFDNETKEVKIYQKQGLIWSAVILVAVVLAWF